MITLRRAAAIPLALMVVLLVGAGVALAQTNGAVTIADFQLSPASMQVASGTTVTWTNNGPANHTATSDSGAFDSGVLAPGKSFSFTFNSPGTFAYHCAIHPRMQGTITVTAAGGSPSPSPRASQAAVPAQMPKTGGGGGLPVAPMLLLGVVMLGGFALWKSRSPRSVEP